MIEIDVVFVIILICILFIGSITNYKTLTFNNYIYNFFVPSMISIFIWYKQCNYMDFLFLMIVLGVLYCTSKYSNKDELMFYNTSSHKLAIQKVAKK